jgi:pimeloyl-ACP methyl ester carboxylesterase
MRRREFLSWTGSALAAGALGGCARTFSSEFRTTQPQFPGQRSSKPMGAVEFHGARRFAELPCGRIAYFERGSGPAALFLHGAPLNGYQWRGAIDRLSAARRCVAPDFMGLGYSEVPEQQSLAADAQTAMIVALLDALGIANADIVASDSGGAVAQLLVVRHPTRVRSLLLTNCDVEPDSPPAKVKPVIEMARAGTLADSTAQWLVDKDLCRSTFGAAVFHDPSHFADDTIETYVRPLVGSPLRRAQYHAFHLALEPNPLAGIESALRRATVPVRLVWGTSDEVFSVADADYLDRLFPHSRGIRRVPEGKLFFPEEFPEVIAEEALELWRS